MLSLSWHCRGSTRTTAATTPRLSPGSAPPRPQLKHTRWEATRRHPPHLHRHLQHTRHGAAGQHPPLPMQPLGAERSAVALCCASSLHGPPLPCQQLGSAQRCCRKQPGLIRQRLRQCPAAWLGRLHLQRAVQLCGEMHSPLTTPQSSPQLQRQLKYTPIAALRRLTKRPRLGGQLQRMTPTQ